MIDARTLDELTRRLTELVPPGVSSVGADLADNIKDVLRSGLRRLDLVTREEFDVQRSVLARTRDKVEALEARIAQLERQLQPPGG